MYVLIILEIPQIFINFLNFWKISKEINIFFRFIFLSAFTFIPVYKIPVSESNNYFCYRSHFCFLLCYYILFYINTTKMILQKNKCYLYYIILFLYYRIFLFHVPAKQKSCNRLLSFSVTASFIVSV